MNKQNIIAPLIIGEVCALIFFGVSRFLELPEIVLKVSKFFPIILPVLSILGVYIASVLGKKFKTLFQFSKSFLVGILNSFIDLGILNLLMWFFSISAGIYYSVFKTISFFIATINSYFWNKYWAFEKKETKPGLKEFFQFSSIAFAGFFIHIIVSYIVVNIIGPQFGITKKLWANIGAIIAIILGFGWNFFGYKLLVFKK